MDVIVMANLAAVAGSYSFTFIGGRGFPGVADLSGSVLWSTVAGLIWITLMTWIRYRGIEVSARIQYVLLSIEVLVLVLFAAFALFRVYGGTAESYSILPQWGWFNPFTLDCGWVVAPGRAAVISTLLLLVTYGLVTVAAVAFAGWARPASG